VNQENRHLVLPERLRQLCRVGDNSLRIIRLSRYARGTFLQIDNDQAGLLSVDTQARGLGHLQVREALRFLTYWFCRMNFL